MTDTEPTVKGSWPLVRLIDGVPHWHIEGTHPPQYARDEALERVWRERNGMQPYYDRNGITIYCGDCRDVLPQLTPSAALLWTDPAYEIESGGNTSGRMMTQRRLPIRRAGYIVITHCALSVLHTARFRKAQP